MKPAGCKHSWRGMCDKCSNESPHLIFEYDRGYVWGPKHPTKANQPARWTKIPDEKQDDKV